MEQCLQYSFRNSMSRQIEIDPMTKIILYLSIFEHQVRSVCVDPKHWVSNFLALLQSDVIQIFVHGAEEKIEDYEYIKGILLK